MVRIHTGGEDTVRSLCSGVQLLSVARDYNNDVDDLVKILDQVLKYVLETRGLLLSQPDNYPDNFVADAIHVLQSSSAEKFNDAIKIFGQQLNTNMALNSTLPSGG